MDMSIMMQAAGTAAAQNGGASQSPRIFDGNDNGFLEILANYWSGNGEGEEDIISSLAGGYYNGTSQDSLMSALGYTQQGSDDLLSSLGYYGMQSQGKTGLEAYLNLMSLQNSTVFDSDGSIKKLAGKIKELLIEAGKGNAGEDDNAELVSLLKKAQSSISKTLELYGNDMAIAELAALMQEAGTPQIWQSDSDLGFTAMDKSTQSKVLQQLISAEPENLWKMLTEGSFYAQGSNQKEFIEAMAAQIAGANEESAKPTPQPEIPASAEKALNKESAAQPEQSAEAPNKAVVWTDPSKLDRIYEKSVMQGARQTDSAEVKAQGSGKSDVPEAEIQKTDEALAKESKFAADAQFSTAIYKAKENIAASPNSKAEAEDDIENVKTAQIQPQGLQQTSYVQKNEADINASRPQEIPLTQQVHTGIVKGISEGKQEFTIKLNPEGLGEITVKLEKAGENMNLKIIAGNLETRNALEARLDVLKDSLKPLKVEVDNIYTEKQFEMLSQQQSSHQQGAFKHFKDGWNMNSRGQGGLYGNQGYGNVNGAVSEAEAESVSYYRADSVLDTYI